MLSGERGPAPPPPTEPREATAWLGGGGAAMSGEPRCPTERRVG